MKLTFVRPTGSEVLAIKWVEIYTNRGSFTIMQNHAPLIALLAEKQEISMELLDGNIKIVPLNSGIIEVNRNTVTIVVTHE